MSVIVADQAPELAQYRSQGFLRQLWRFARPHTIIGTSLSLVTLWWIALGLTDQSIDTTALFVTLVACIGANVFIVGLNQLTDVPLDKINKPYLPLASGAWSVRTGQAVVGVSLLVSLIATVYLASSYLWWTVGLSLLLGTAYSLPPTRLKRFPFWAAFCIVAVRSLIVNLLLFVHLANWQGGATNLPPLVWLLAGVMFAFSIAIAWFKDLPDLAGDAAFDVRTLPVRLGADRVLRYGTLVLAAVLIASAAFAFWRLDDFLLANLQVLVLFGFIYSVRRVVLTDAKSLRTFYLTLWGLFFAEYLAFALVAVV